MALMALFLPLPLFSQSYTNEDIQLKDSLTSGFSKSEWTVKQMIVPLSLMAYGTLEASLYPKYRLLNYAVGHEVITHKPIKFRIDDYTQYVPAASVYLLNLVGVRGRHNFKDRTIILGMAGLFTGISVNALKYTVRKQRPDKSAANSFPSGHAAIAFMGAEFLWQEYKDVSIWYGIGGYAIAAGTGAFRVYNNKHWVGDVIFGAGLGILCTKLTYHFYPKVKRKLSFKRKADKNKAALTVYPYYNGQQGGISISKQF